MNVYQVREDCSNFKCLQLDQRKLKGEALFKVMDEIECNGLPKTNWTPPPLHAGNPLRPEPDFWFGISGGLVIHPRAFEDVSEFAEMAGELHPLPFKGLNLQVLNILQVWDCIDEDKSEWLKRTDGSRINLLKPYFVSEHFGASPLFKIPELPMNIYCWEHNEEPEEEFKARVEAEELTGLKFDLIWSNKTRARSRNK